MFFRDISKRFRILNFPITFYLTVASFIFAAPALSQSTKPYNFDIYEYEEEYDDDGFGPAGYDPDFGPFFFDQDFYDFDDIADDFKEYDGDDFKDESTGE